MLTSPIPVTTIRCSAAEPTLRNGIRERPATSVGELTELRLNAPEVGNWWSVLCISVTGSPAAWPWREHWLPTCVDHCELNAALWRFTRTALAAAATMDTVDDPHLREHTLAGGHDIAGR